MCRYRFLVLSSCFNNRDLGLVRLLLPLLGLSMVAGSSVLRGGHAARSVNLGVALTLPWLVVSSVPCCRVAMVAALKLCSSAKMISCAGKSCEPKDHSLMKELVQGVLKVDGGVVNRVHLTLAPVLGAGCELGLALCWELAAMPRQVQDNKADASNSFAESPGLLLQIFMGSRFECGSKPCNFFPMYKDWNLSGTVQWFAASYPITINQFGIWLAAIDSTLFLLLQTWYNLVKFEKHITILDLLLLKIRMEKMICKNFTQPSPIPSRCGVLLVIQVNGDFLQNDKFNQVDYGMLLLHMDQTAEVSINLELTCGPFESLPMVFAAQGLECQRWNNFLSVNLWSQANITATILKHQLCSHTTKEIHGQQKSSSCLYACKTFKTGNAIKVRYSCFMISTCTMFYLLDDHLVEDAVLPLFGLCHQRWTTTPLSLIPRFNGGDPLRLSSVMVPQNLLLDPSQPRVHTPDRPLGERTRGASTGMEHDGGP